MLRGWHLLSLDAPTVAFCWTLLFAESMHVPHALAQAGALACAVWLVYVGDRLLDARQEPASAWPDAPHAALARLYRNCAGRFLLAGAAVSLLTINLLCSLPPALREAWLLLLAPLALYAAAVHLLSLPGRWKGVCVGIFFAAAVTLPAAVHDGLRWPLASAAVAFGGVCRANCAVLRAPSRRLRIVLTMSMAAVLLPLWSAETRVIVPACAGALGLLLLLVQKRDALCARFGWLAWRALVDGALVAPALLVTLIVSIGSLLVR